MLRVKSVNEKTNESNKDCCFFFIYQIVRMSFLVFIHFY